MKLLINLRVFGALIFLFDVYNGEKIKLVNGGYEDIVIAISPLLQENDRLITEIKTAVKEMSQGVYRASRSSLYFRNVTILLPETWNNTAVDSGPIDLYEDAVIRIEEKNPVYGHQPYTIQPGGCGEPGKYIHLTSTYLTDKNKACVWGPRGKTLAREWAKVRWGVFDELGYAGDPLFPLFYWVEQDGITVEGREGKQSFIRPNYCSDQPINGKLIDPATDSPCNHQAGNLDNECRFVPHFLQNATASIMSQHQISGVNEFCDSRSEGKYDHDSKAPTRHNLACDGASLWQVITRHPDLANIKEVPKMDPTFRTVRVTTPSYVLLFDTTRFMLNSIDALPDSIRAAKNWILNDLMLRSRVSVGRFGLIAMNVKSLTQMKDQASRIEVIDSLDNVKTDLGETVCYICAMRHGLMETKGLNKSVFIIITGGEPKMYEPTDSQDTLDEITKLGIKVLWLVFSDTSVQAIDTLAAKVGGNLYYKTKENPVNRVFQEATTAQPQLPLTKRRMLIYDDKYFGRYKSTFSGSFAIDQRLNRNVTLEFWSSDASRIGMDPFLVTPKNTRVDSKKSTFDNQLWIAEVEEAQAGTWRWEVLLRTGLDISAHAKITAEPNPQLLPVHLEAWLNTSSESIDAAKEAVSIHARLLQGTSPVANAQVRVDVTLPNNQTYNLTLLDSGTGTDALKGDGIYSRLLSNLTTTGIHSFTVKAWGDGNTTYYLDNSYLLSADLRSPVASSTCGSSVKPEDPPTYCCGSRIPTNPKYQKATGNFTRVVFLQTNVKNVPSKNEEDKVAPSRVVDLQIINVFRDELKLEFTAAGDDFDLGSASKYEIFVTTSLNDLPPSNKDSTMVWPNGENITDFPEFGEKVEIFVNLTESIIQEDTLYYVAVCALDDADNMSPVSNIGRLMLPDVVSQPLPLRISPYTFALGSFGIVILGLCITG